LRLRCSFRELLLCVCHSSVHKKRSVDTTLFCDFICLKALVPSWKEAENASWGCRVLYTIQARLPQMIFRSVFVESCPSFGAPFVACLDVDLAKRSNPCRIVGDLHVSFPHSTRKKSVLFWTLSLLTKCGFKYVVPHPRWTCCESWVVWKRE